MSAHAGIHRPTTPTPEKNTPSFPRRRESTIPAHAGIHRPTTPMPEKNTPSFPRRRESTIPAHAGIHRPTTPTPEKNTPSFPRRRESTMSAHAGIHRPTTPTLRRIRHSRAGGNPQCPAHAGIHRPTTPTPEKNTPSFPRRRESTIPAYAGIHRGYPNSEEYSVIPAKAGIHNSRARGNSQCPTTPTPEKIPAFAGMTQGIFGNDVNEFPRARECGFPHSRE